MNITDAVFEIEKLTRQLAEAHNDIHKNLNTIRDVREVLRNKTRQLAEAREEIARLGNDVDDVNCFAEKLSDFWMLQYRGMMETINKKEAEIAQVRKIAESAPEGLYNGYEPDNQSARYKELKAAIETAKVKKE